MMSRIYQPVFYQFSQARKAADEYYAAARSEEGEHIPVAEMAEVVKGALGAAQDILTTATLALTHLGSLTEADFIAPHADSVATTIHAAETLLADAFDAVDIIERLTKKEG